MDINKKCSNCYINDSNKKIWTVRNSPNFSWDKYVDKEYNFLFCSKECKKEWVERRRKQDLASLPYLAELDESMNYCEYFIRINWNEWIYKKDWFEYNVNWLWDYKSFNLRNAKEFKQAYINNFWNFNRFKIHNRYKI